MGGKRSSRGGVSRREGDARGSVARANLAHLGEGDEGGEGGGAGRVA